MKKLINTNEKEIQLYTTAEEFRDTLVAPVLEGIVATEAYENLLALLQNPLVNIYTGRKSCDTTTFGDVAALLTDVFFYLREDVEELPDFARQLVDIYFACFEDEDADSKPQSVREFLCMPFDALYRFADECMGDNELPNDCKEACAAYHTEGKSVQEVYNEAKADMENGRVAAKAYAQLVRLFADPVAMLQLFPAR